MKDNRHEAVLDWIRECPTITDIFFNFSDGENGDTVLVPQTSHNDTIIQEYVDGSSERAYEFTIICIEAYSTVPNSTENLEILMDVDSIAEWVEQQNEIGNFPEFPTNCSIASVECVTDDSLAAMDETGAKYMLQFRILYDYKRGD